MRSYINKKVLNYSGFALIALVFFSTFSHAAGGKGSTIPNRTNVSCTYYLVIMLSIGLLYGAFLYLRARRRKKHSGIELKYSK